jgi:CheY-like chemotaxis protein
VDNPQGKPVICFDKRSLYVESVVQNLKKLGAPVTLCVTEEEFLGELKNYSFAFAPADTAEKAADLIAKQSLSTSLVLLAASGDTASCRNIPAVIMPAYAVTLANVLNRRGMTERRKRRGRFVAPDARVLVVDDIQTNLTVARGLLALFKSVVDICAGGREAVEMVKKNQYDIVFMDHMMPVMDGIEATRTIRAIEGDYYRNLPIVALTANAINGMRETFLQNGFNDYLSKPIEIAKLNDIMETWIPADKKWPLYSTQAEGVGEESVSPSVFGEDIFVEGLDFAAGKKRYGEQTYLEVLRSYNTHTPALLEKMRMLAGAAFTEESLREYTITVHGLKGSSFGVCAGETGGQAEALEHAARNGDIRFIAANNGRLIETAETLERNIRNLLARLAKPAEAKPRAPAPDPALLAKLLEDCGHYRTNLIEKTLKELESREYESGGELVKWLREQFDNLEYDAMLERLKQ